MKQFIEQRFPLEQPYGFLQLFAEGGENGAGGDGGDSGGDGGNGGNGGGNSPGKGEKMFSQAELDAHVQSRVARAERDAKTALAKELGFESVEAMKAALKKPGDGSKGSEPADVEKIVQQQLEARLKEEHDRTFQRLLTAEVKVVANELGFADWEDALKLADLSGAKENDKGEVEGVREALEKLAKDKPHLLKSKQGSGRFGAHINNNQQDDRSKRLQQIADLAKNRGVAQTNVNDPWARK